MNKVSSLPVHTLTDIRNVEPCYDPVKYVPEDWTGTALDVLKHPDVSPKDKLWLVCREDWIDVKTLRLFGCWCARQALALQENPDLRSVEAVLVSEGYADGTRTLAELNAARSAAWSAESAESAESAAWSAARSAAWSAAWSAESAAKSAARSAAESAWSAAEPAQVEHLIAMLEGAN